MKKSLFKFLLLIITKKDEYKSYKNLGRILFDRYYPIFTKE